MALIKSANAASMVSEAIVLDLGDLRRQADAMRTAAQEQARQILHAARAEAVTFGAAAEKRGHAEGFARGQAAGLETGHKKGHDAALAQVAASLQQLQAAWLGAAQTWEDQRRQMLLEARQTLLNLAVEMARKIVHRVPAFDPTVVADQVAAAIEHVARPCDVSVRIHPADRPLLLDAMPKLARQLGQHQHVTLVDDETVGRGGCVVSYGKGRIDATLDTQLNRLIDAMLGGGDEAAATRAADDDAPASPAAPDGAPSEGEGA